MDDKGHREPQFECESLGEYEKALGSSECCHEEA